MSRIAATLLLSVGGFGDEVAARLGTRVRTRAEERPADLAIVQLDLRDGDREAALDAAEEQLVTAVTSQLALSALVDRSPDESSPPWLDLFIVGDLAEPAVRAIVEPLLDRARDVVSARFSNVLGRDASRLLLMPLLALGGGDDDEPPTPADVAATLVRTGEPRVRPFLIEQQTERYILSRDELVSTAVAALELFVLAGLRDSEHLAAFLRGDMPRATGSSEPAPFATLGVASVHVDARIVGEYCRNRSALSLVEAMRSGRDLGLEEREGRARELRLPWDEVRERLGLAARSDAAFKQIEKIVLEEAPHLPCPEIEPSDSPEEIRQRKFGDDWYRAVGGAIDDLILKLERRRMTELADRIDAAGLEVARRRHQQVRERVDRWVWESPRGWAAARSTLALLRDEAAATERDTTRHIAGISLPAMPTPERLHRPVIALRQESERRPRPFRLWLTGVVLVILATLFGYPLLSLLRYPFDALDAPSWLIDAVTPPWGLLTTAVIAVPLIALNLRAMVRRRHEELLEVRDSLEREMGELVTGRQGSVLAYYLARLELAREKWVLRLARSDRRLFEQELERLDEVQRALDTLWDQLRADQRRLGVRYADDNSNLEDLSQVRAKDDLILREAVDGPLLVTSYAAAVPDEEDLAARFHGELRDASLQWRRALPMADRARMERFLDRALELPRPGDLLAGSADVENGLARRAVERVFHDLLTRLSPTLGLNEAATGSASSWVIWAPRAADTLVEEALETLRERYSLESLGSSWLRLTSPRDDGRIYLAVLVMGLPRAAIGALSP